MLNAVRQSGGRVVVKANTLCVLFLQGAAAIHADPDTVGLEHPGEFGAGALVVSHRETIGYLAWKLR